ncbi:DUF4191 domain-containing protein [Schaalia sp. 19OD2882]|uniref:DUF4191 domain-containing protein n=1 Tax=Schaalia sp. 19OD2882 TaxID=2794089 RepID=UPI001C1EB0EB|nr:DUF4191 domain-containing protein [Schaalia sp. 19OD2882]QWW18743.1 DUF4191 domain-containing protein [Schaalia sp. 19OD2882]
MSEKTPSPKKRRWYHNLADAYTITARTYTWIPWALAGAALASITIALVLAWATSGTLATYLSWGLVGVLTGALAAMALLAWLVRPAMYQQIDGTLGAVYAVLSQIKSGWIVSEEPIAGTRNKDIVWRIIGRPGVVLISEGPSSRVRPLLEAERKKVMRVAKNVPVHLIEVGNDDHQVPLKKLEGTLRRLKNVLTKEEVPAISQRLAALSRAGASIPKGVDLTRVRPSRRALRGR